MTLPLSQKKTYEAFPIHAQEYVHRFGFPLRKRRS
jgi:hypothetical protein